MGCCLSAGNHNPDAEHGSSVDGAPPTSPPGVIEEEAVKEELMEIPVAPKADEKIRGMPPGNRELKAEAEPTAMVPRNFGRQEKGKEETLSEVSEASEMCSYSENFSNATVQEKKDDDDDGVVDQGLRRGNGGHTAEGGEGERVVARRMAGPPTEKRGQVAPLRPARGRPVVAGQPRNVAEENGRKRDVAEGPRWRSRSPVRRDEVDAPQNASDQKIPEAGESANDVVAAEEAETLENPVVSLECFIFLWVFI